MMKKFLLTLGLAAFFSGAAVAGDCQRLSSVCVDATPVKNIQGLNVTVEQVGGCWAFEDTYQCRSAATVNDCQPLRDRGCAQIGTKCVDKDDNGTCVMYESSYQCPDKPETYTEKTVCDQSAFCQNGGAGCFDTSAPPDKDFGQAAVMMEAAREAGVYGVNGDNIEIFKGYAEECSIKTIGGSSIKSCCKASSGGAGFSNYAVLGVTAKAAYAVGKEELKAGSKYMYDALFQAQDAGLIESGASAAAGGLSSGAAEGVASQAGTQFGAYGFEFSYSASGGFSFVGFDPYSFAFAVAVQIVTAWLQCDANEQTMQLKRGQNLCVYLGTYCSSKVLGVCVERKEKHCCFNSILAKLVNRQGRAQLGMPMDQCGGFNQDQIQQIDFSRIDFSEFIATIVPTNTDASSNTPGVTNTVNKMIDDYYGTRTTP